MMSIHLVIKILETTEQLVCLVQATANYSKNKHFFYSVNLIYTTCDHNIPWLINRHNSLPCTDFSDKGRAIKGFIVCWMLLNLISTIEH